MKLLRYSAAIALIVAVNSGAFSSAFAADPVFPPGAKVGMTPLVGLNKAKTFIGFETEDHGVKVLIADLPAEAYGEVANAFKAAPGGTGGIKPESIETAAGLAYYTVENGKENAKDGAAHVRRYQMTLPGPTFPGVRDGRITMSEPVRIDGQPGYETRIDATSGKDNTPVTIVQWVRFGAQTSMRIIGSSPRDDWTKAFPRFRAVRDGIHPRT